MDDIDTDLAWATSLAGSWARRRRLDECELLSWLLEGLWRSQSTHDPSRSRAFATTFARCRAIDQFRRRDPTVDAAWDLAKVADPRPNGCQDVDNRDEVAWLLEGDCDRGLVMARALGETFAMIAARNGLRGNGVQKRHARALARVRRRAMRW